MSRAIRAGLPFMSERVAGRKLQARLLRPAVVYDNIDKRVRESKIDHNCVEAPTTTEQQKVVSLLKYSQQDVMINPMM
jgi:hypothetical protein